MIGRAKKRALKTGFQNYTLHLCDCRRLPFEDDTFDILMNQYLLDILPLKISSLSSASSNEFWRKGWQNYSGQHHQGREVAQSDL